MSVPLRPDEATLSTVPTDDACGIAVSPHHLASDAGIEILRAGGNAVEAAIAINAVLGVILPDTCGPGGDLFALIHNPGDEIPSALNASGRAGSGATGNDLRDTGLGAIPARGHESITVPGCVDGWEALVAKHGTLPLSTLLAPAIGFARNGFPVSDELASSFVRLHELIGDQPSAAPFYPGGTPAEAGASIARPRFGDTLDAISQGGRTAFYEGPAGEATIIATRGAITPEDLSSSQAEWVVPISKTVFGRSAWTMPPNSQGYLTLATLRIFEMLDPPNDPNDPLYQHLLIEAYRSVAWDREQRAVDTDHTTMSDLDLISDERLAMSAADIDRKRSGRWPMARTAPGGTAFMTVRDSAGMGVSLIQSNFSGIGSGISAGDTGVFLHNRGAGFNLIPGHPNEYAVQKRPLHTLSPTLWTDDDQLDLLLGTRGGDRQPQFLAQFSASFYHAGNSPDDSQDLPRWNMSQPHPGTDSIVEFEARTNPSTVDGLVDRGHTIELVRSYEQEWGPVSAIDCAQEIKGSADPRISTSAAMTTATG